MAIKLLLTAEKSRRKLNGHELVPLVRAGVKFVDGVRAEREADERVMRPSVAKGKSQRNHTQDGKVAA